MNILIVADNWSMRWGGESSFPIIYARHFLRRGASLWMVAHGRVREEMLQAFPEHHDRISFIEDTPGMLRLGRLSRGLPYRIKDLFVSAATHMMTQRLARRTALELVGSQPIDVVFEPFPISPKALSYMYGLGVPVVIGPMCGGMDFPPAFRDYDSRATRAAVALGRRASLLAHYLAPGKRRADVLIVANERTRAALPPGCRGRVVTVVESGVDLSTWSADERPDSPATGPVRFVFSGRFVDWKGVQFLLDAFLKVRGRRDDCVLELIGDGELGPEIRERCAAPELKDRVRLHGWLSRPDAARVIREADIFVMPSLRECGGGAILEAMALGKPIVAANWGGPGAYVNETCGILVEPSSKDAYVDGLADAMDRLAASEELRTRLGRGGRERIRQEYFDWESKGDRVLEILEEAIRTAGRPARRLEGPSRVEAAP
jgi:glycosyltransferase involved in cell wall biosynthesis